MSNQTFSNQTFGVQLFKELETAPDVRQGISWCDWLKSIADHVRNTNAANTLPIPPDRWSLWLLLLGGHLDLRGALTAEEQGTLARIENKLYDCAEELNRPNENLNPLRATFNRMRDLNQL